MADLRIGTGVDVHALGASGPLVLAGVRVRARGGLVGHSDGDVVAHAVADALLGAAALGDLGTRFGVADPDLAGADSMDLLRRVTAEVGAAGYRVVNLDLTVVAEEPRLDPVRQAMREGLAAALELDPGAVSVKLTTTDGLGALGRGEGVACTAACLLEGR